MLSRSATAAGFRLCRDVASDVVCTFSRSAVLCAGGSIAHTVRCDATAGLNDCSPCANARRQRQQHSTRGVNEETGTTCWQ